MTPLVEAVVGPTPPWVVVALFALSFFFSGSERALFALQKLDRNKLAARSATGAMVDRLIRWGRRPLRTTLLFGNVAAKVALTAVTAQIVAQLAPDHPWLGVVLLTPALVVVSDLTPKVLADHYPRTWSVLAVWPLTAWYFAIAPLRLVFGLAVAGLARLFGAQAESDHDGLEEQELMVLVDRGAASGAVAPDERDIIEAVFEFDELTVDRLMTPRPDMLSLSIDQSWDDLVRRARDANRSRIPIYQGRPEDVVGVLLVKDLLRYRSAPPEGPRQLRGLLLPPTFVPGTKSADAMLREFLTRRLHMAFVVDEHGSLVGLITLDDLLNELLGDDPAEDTGEQEVQQVHPDALTVRAAIDVDDFEEETGITLPEGDWNTVGGFVFHELGRLPRKGDRITWDQWTFQVASMEGRRIHELEVRKAPPTEGAAT